MNQFCRSKYQTCVEPIVVILAVVIGILFFTIILDVRELQFCTEPVEAEYVDLKRNSKYGAIAYYNYSFDGKFYNCVGATHIVNFGEDKDLGETYTIYVNPDEPTCFKTISGDISLTVFFKFIICIVFGFLISYILQSTRKPERLVYHKEYPAGIAVMQEFDDSKHHDT